MTFLVRVSILTLFLKLWLQASKANLSLFFPTVSHFISFFFFLILRWCEWPCMFSRQDFFLPRQLSDTSPWGGVCMHRKEDEDVSCFRGEMVLLCWSQAGSLVPAPPLAGPLAQPLCRDPEMFCCVCEHWCCHSTQPSGLLHRTQCLEHFDLLCQWWDISEALTSTQNHCGKWLSQR